MSEIILSILTELRLESRSKLIKKQCLGSNNQALTGPRQQSQELQMAYSRKTRESSHLETGCQVLVGAGIGWEE